MKQSLIATSAVLCGLITTAHSYLSTSEIAAVRTELQRAQDSLRSSTGLKPLALDLKVVSIDEQNWTASLGSLESKTSDTDYRFNVRMILGDSLRDQLAFYGRPNQSFRLPRLDSLNLRRALWAAIDRLYRENLTTFDQKQAWLSQNPRIKDRKSWRSVPPVQHQKNLSPRVSLDTSLLIPKLLRLSQKLDPQSTALESRAMFQSVRVQETYLNVDGSFTQTYWDENTWVGSTLIQTADGEPIWDYIRYSSPDLRAALSYNTDSAAQDCYERLVVTSKVEPAPSYQGPLILQGTAAGSFWANGIVSMLSQAHQSPSLTQSKPKIHSLLGRRILPAHIQITAVTDSIWQGKALYGVQRWDEEGILSEYGTLVENGRLRRLPVSRFLHPSEKPDSTLAGHLHMGAYTPGVLKITANLTADGRQYGRVLDSLAKAEGLAKLLVQEKDVDADAAGLLQHPLAMDIQTPPRIGFYDPSTGKITPTRGLSIPFLEWQETRDAYGFSSETTAFEFQGNNTIIAPNRLVIPFIETRAKEVYPPQLLLP